ncbi:hypothetical protein AB6N23_12155 [Cellulomonas sp. 179-A 9B4 NHS]|uniref:hypothetical protein n=1 Tax=Cellulomonas sp. 179-A 9B4 NHS TaxID=3142379 RepID=UPI0039A2B003
MRRPSTPVALASFCLFVVGFALTGSGHRWLGLLALVAASVVMSVAFAVRRRATEEPREPGR